MYSTGNFSTSSEYSGKCLSSAKMALFIVTPYLRGSQTARQRVTRHTKQQKPSSRRNTAKLCRKTGARHVLLTQFHGNMRGDVEQRVAHAENGAFERTSGHADMWVNLAGKRRLSPPAKPFAADNGHMRVCVPGVLGQF